MQLVKFPIPLRAARMIMAIIVRFINYNIKIRAITMNKITEDSPINTNTLWAFSLCVPFATHPSPKIVTGNQRETQPHDIAQIKKTPRDPILSHPYHEYIVSQSFHIPLYLCFFWRELKRTHMGFSKKVEPNKRFFNRVKLRYLYFSLQNRMLFGFQQCLDKFWRSACQERLIFSFP